MPVSTGHLLGLQQWIQANVMAEEPPTDAEAARIRPSATLTPVERLGIYRGMYEARLIDALKVDDPGLLHYLGEAMFDELASLYVGANPSRSYSLNRLGDRLPGFLAEVDGLRRPALVADLARLELLETEVFDERESSGEGLPPLDQIADDDWPGMRLQPIYALRVETFRYPVQRYLAALRAGETVMPVLRARATHLVIFRRNHKMFHLPLSPSGAALLRALVAQQTLAEAGLASTKVFGHFSRWSSEGLFRSLSATR